MATVPMKCLLFLSWLFFDSNELPLLFNDITYGFYPVYGDLYKVKYEEIPLTDELKVDIAAYDRPNGGIIMCNPNAPTGEFIPLDVIEALVAKNKDSLVIVDEAYIDFGGESAVGLVDKYDNLLVVQTFSKSRSLAGLRVGMAFGNAGLINALETIKYSVNPYSLDSVALAGATAAIKYNDLSLEPTKVIMENREYLKGELEKLGFTVLESKANFLFATHATVQAEDIYLKLKDEGVLVRFFKKERIDNYLRITIGTKEEIDTLLEKLIDKKIV